MPDPSPPYSMSRRAGHLLFVSGQLGRDADGRFADGLVAQTRAAIGNLARELERAGASVADVVKVQVFLDDIADWSDFNEEYLRWFSDPLPARSAIGAGLPAPALVEIEAVAVLADHAAPGVEG
ncbi:2-iminobutanoate/2-iminopropanoate deaminase [Nocardioides thalensis]|uniref:2-iminobutanoate/2-iminopropanoate deaminase n=1 Tax=Nocardioides thalensis TaxID=1914755 RepID=A0A853BXG1_9ACTN|nr:RidA family protein [Nocardioides thalensis]NYI99650.1 2-iminobutanoate/2-iminopropanoate deaminase [Nocardioides thalensis]